MARYDADDHGPVRYRRANAKTLESASRPEEPPQQVAGFVAEYAGLHVDAMVVPIADQGVEHAAGSAGLGIAGAEDDPRDARMHDGAGAHHARLERHVERGAWKTVVAQAAPGGAQCLDLGVRARIAGRNVAVPAFADGLPVHHEDGADGHFAVMGLGVPGEFEGTLHPLAVDRVARVSGISAGAGGALRHGGSGLPYSHSIVAGGLPLMS